LGDLLSFAVACLGGPANGAWFEGHALEGDPPAQIRIAIGSDGGPALLDLPDDQLELGERVEIYVRRSVGMMCVRGKGRCCNRVATYVPEGVAAGGGRSRTFMREVREAAGVSPPLRVAE
jgi:hypothetical protein